MPFQVTRIDLADKGSPEGIVSLILKHEPKLPIPVPIEELCRQLDIEDICPLETEGFEGGLITDVGRSRGIILVKDGVSLQRRRFTIGHELGHFLMATHVPDQEGRFLCSREDLSRLSAKEEDRRSRMEVEANRFSSLILIPPPALRAAIRDRTSPDLRQVFALAGQFQVSKEAMARAYADYQPEAVAFVIVKNGIVLRCYRNRTRFPFITAQRQRPVPQGSILYQKGLQPGIPSDIDARLPDLWIDVERGRTAPSMSEQVCMQANGFAIIMLWYEPVDEPDDYDDDRTARDRWRERQSRFGS